MYAQASQIGRAGVVVLAFKQCTSESRRRGATRTIPSFGLEVTISDRALSSGSADDAGTVTVR